MGACDGANASPGRVGLAVLSASEVARAGRRADRFSHLAAQVVGEVVHHLTQRVGVFIKVRMPVSVKRSQLHAQLRVGFVDFVQGQRVVEIVHFLEEKQRGLGHGVENRHHRT